MSNTGDSEMPNKSSDENNILTTTNSPKTSAKSRLAPLEITSEKMRSIRIREFEMDPKINKREAGSASSTTSASSVCNDSQVEANWKTHIEPLLNLLHTYFKGKFCAFNFAPFETSIKIDF